MRWRPILCLWGLTLFGLLTYDSMRLNSMRFSAVMRQQHHHNRYFWWGTVRLDSDPLRSPLKPCMEDSDTNCDWDYMWVRPGLTEMALTLTAFPALQLAIAIAGGLALLGISELLSFMCAMPLLTFAWFYAVGWLLDRWRYQVLHGVPTGQ